MKKGPSAFLLRESRASLQAGQKASDEAKHAALLSQNGAADGPARGRPGSGGSSPPGSKETSLGRARREREEKEAYDRKLRVVTELYRGRVEEKRRYDVLKARARKLQSRLHLRPNDTRTLSQLVSVVYEMKDYIASVQVIRKAVRHVDLQSSRLYILLGRCHLRRWKKDGTVPDLSLALAAYREAMRDPDMQRAAVSSPVPYFELAGTLLRLGKHQAALDTLGAVLQIFKEGRDDWTWIAQYSVAQILVMLGDGEGALKLYRRLMMCPLVVMPEELRSGGSADHCILLSTRMLSMLVSVEMAVLQRGLLGQSKLSVALLKECFEHHERRMKMTNDDAHAAAVDIRFGAKDWQSWVTSPATFKQLGDLFRRELNVAMAAEMYGTAAELLNKLPHPAPHSAFAHIQHKRVLLGLVLDRGECMAELRNSEQAEQCAMAAFAQAPLDPVVVARAARCCQRGAADGHEALQLPPDELPEANRLVIREAQRVVRAVGIIMGLLRVHVARRRREAKTELGVYASKINSVVRMCLARSRTAAARLDVVATIRIGKLLHSLRCVWRTGRNAREMYAELWNLSVRGIQHLIRMFLFRRRVSRVSRAVTTCKKIWRAQVVRRSLRRVVARIQADLDQGRPARNKYPPFGGITRGDGLLGRERLSAGVNIITNDQNLPSVAEASTTSTYSHSSVASGGGEGGPGAAFRSTSSFASSSSSQPSLAVGEVSVASKPRAMRRQPPPGLRSSSLGAAWFSSAAPLRSSSGAGMASALLAATASFCSQEELEAHVRACRSLGEDVPCLLGIRSVLDDATVRWVPFCILPDDAVRRLLTATALMLTAQSFGVMDCMRVAYVVRARRRLHGDEGIWQSLRSLFVQGTRMGHRGFEQLRALGLGHLHTLSLSGVGLLPALGVELGQMLADVAGGGCALEKLYIESEPKFGNKGVIALMRFLQYNTSLRILSLRDCRLGRDCVSPVANFLSLSTHLQVLHLSDNLFKLHDCRVLVRSVANKGLKGAFRALYLQGSTVSHDELERIYKEGLELGVNVVTPIGFRKELLGELAVKNAGRLGAGKDAELHKRAQVAHMIQERLRAHQLDLSDPNLTTKEVVF